MTATTAPALAPRPAPPRPRVVLVGTAFAAAAVSMGLLALIGVYLAQRADVLAGGGQTWLPEGSVIPLTVPNMAAVTLIMSAVTVQWAVYSIGNNDRINANIALGLTLVFGFAYLNSAAYLYTQMTLGIRDSVAGLLIYTVSGTHIAITIGAMIFVLVMAFRTLAGQYASRDQEGVAAAALFWHTTVALYLVIWYAVYITK
jgi:heme/copper-type cytochrome/quinol oxidase subunit 3